jgi:hypothetical protein
MQQFGFHAANKRPLNVDEMLDVGGTHYVVIVTDEIPWLDMVKKIRVRRPLATILLRPYFVSDLFQNPIEVARWAYNKILPALPYTKHIVVGNEFNIETPVFAAAMYLPQHWKVLNQWNVQSIRTLWGLNDELRIHWPAISPQVGDDKSQMNPPGMEYCRESIEMADELDCHIYWPPGCHLQDCFGLRYQWVHELFPNKTLFVSECGPNDVRRPDAGQEIVDWYKELQKYPYVRGTALFSWNWGEDNATWNYYDKPDLVAKLTAFPKAPVAANPEPWPTTQEVKEAVFRNLFPQGVPYNPQTAFWSIAKREGATCPLTREFDHNGFRMQAWTRRWSSTFVTLARIDKWGDIRVYEYDEGLL